MGFVEREIFKIKKNWKRLLFWSIIAGLSIYVIRQHFNVPLYMTMYSSRQSMVALIVQTWLNDGLDILNYKIPVLTPPWTIPMEFPIFEIVVYAIIKVTGISSIALVCKILNVMSFYVSAYALHKIINMYLNEKFCGIITMIYLFSPYNLYWSRAAMIDYMATALGLIYIYYMLKWFVYEKKILYYLLALLMGTAGYLCKSTSMFPIVIFLAPVLIFEFKEKVIQSKGTICSYILEHKLEILFEGLLCVLPTMAGFWWVKYSDKIKEMSITSAGYTSYNMQGWNFGTLQEKLDISKWYTMLEIHKGFWPHILICVLPVSILFFICTIKNKRERIIIIASSLATFGTIFILFNLYYVHNYYHIAIVPFSTIIISIMPFLLIGSLEDKKLMYQKAVTLARIIVIFLLGYEYADYTCMLGYLKPEYETEVQITEGDFNRKIDLITSHTGYKDYLVIQDTDWATDVLYYSNRKGYSLYKEPNREIAAILHENNYKYMMIKDKKWFKWANSIWDEVELIDKATMSNGDIWSLYYIR